MKKEDVFDYVSQMKARLAGTPDFEVKTQTKDQLITVWSKAYPNTAAVFDLGLNTVTASSGSRYDAGALNELINNDIMVKNASYIIDDHFFIWTDAEGRPYRYWVDYDKEWTVEHDLRPRQILNKGALDGDQKAHVIAASLRGMHERINILPMPKKLNERYCRFQETFLANCLSEFEKSSEKWFLKLRIDVSYKDTQLRPESIRLEADVNGKSYSGHMHTKCFY